METQIKTAKEVLAQIERRYFKGAGLAKASTLEGDERRTYVLAQAERLLTTEHGSSPLAMWLSDEFWTADEGRKPMFEDNPLLSLKEQQTLTDKEMGPDYEDAPQLPTPATSCGAKVTNIIAPFFI